MTSRPTTDHDRSLDMTDDTERFILWTIIDERGGIVATDELSRQQLVDAGHLSMAAAVRAERGQVLASMSVHDICHQFNNVNGGEVWLTEDVDPAPWIALRTTANSDGTDPEQWSFFCNDEADARSWLDAGQVDVIRSANA